MFANRILNILVVLALGVVILFTFREVAATGAIAQANRSFSMDEAMQPGYAGANAQAPSSFSMDDAAQPGYAGAISEAFGRYQLRNAAVPQNASQLRIAQAQRVNDFNEQHAEALQNVPAEQGVGAWCGANPQNASQLSIAQAQCLHDLIERHGEALQGP